jgi:hypothetical protein
MQRSLPAYFSDRFIQEKIRSAPASSLCGLQAPRNKDWLTSVRVSQNSPAGTKLKWNWPRIPPILGTTSQQADRCRKAIRVGARHGETLLNTEAIWRQIKNRVTSTEGSLSSKAVQTSGLSSSPLFVHSFIYIHCFTASLIPPTATLASLFTILHSAQTFSLTTLSSGHNGKKKNVKCVMILKSVRSEFCASHV